MSAMHPSWSYKGCALCKPHKRRGVGDAVKMPAAALRKLGGSEVVKRKALNGEDR